MPLPVPAEPRSNGHKRHTATMTEITCQVELTDLKAFWKRQRKVSPNSRRIRRLLLAIAALMSLHFSWSLEVENLHLGYRTILFAIVFGFLVLGGSLGRMLVMWVYARNARRDGERHGFLGSQTYRLEPGAFYARDRNSETRHLWSGLYLIDSTPEHFFFFLHPESAYTLPRRAFPSPAAAEAFLAIAKDFREKQLAENPAGAAGLPA